ncbi:MAG: hypothetical protein ACRDJL_05300 [Actinomycetota bacterium]
MRPPALPSWAVALAGPLLIVLTVVVVLHDFAFGGRFSNLNPDVPTVFLTNHCFLGESLKAGHIPAWNPYPMLGTPFIADPQSGWMYLTPMLLYTLLPCSVALGAFTVLQPIIAGLGVYFLLRGERISRAAATAGGLTLALAIAASKVLVVIPLTDALAWTAVLLPLVGRLLRARAWPSRLLWVIAVALAWGQVASAHLSHGLVMGTAAAVFYGVYVVLSERPGTRVSGRDLMVTVAVTLVALVAVNLAHLLPVVSYMQRASLGQGYDEMQRIAAELRGAEAPEPSIARALGVTWPLRFSTAPGLYLAALPLMLMSAGFVARRTRWLAITFGSLGLLFYLAGMARVIETVAPLISGLPFADFYRHSSGRFVYGALLAAVIVAAIGIDAWRDAASARQRALMVAPGLLVWGLLPIVAGVIPARMVLFGLGATAAAVLLYLTARRPALAWAIPVVIAVELAGGAFVGQAAGFELRNDGLETRTDRWLPFVPLPEPGIDASSYIDGGPITRALEEEGGGRLLGVGISLTWNLRPIVSEVEMPSGYNPVQLDRYWRYVRSIVAERLRYNMSLWPEVPPDRVLDLLGVEWISRSAEEAPEEDRDVVAADDKRVAYATGNSPGRATLLGRWSVVEGPERARRAVTDESFDPGEIVVLEAEPGIEPPNTTGEPGEIATPFEWITPARARIEVETEGPAILLVRNAWDENWGAEVDGGNAEVLVGDYFLQAIALPRAGTHVVELNYVDPNIGYGLAGTGISLIVLAGAALLIKTLSARRASAHDTEEGPA